MGARGARGGGCCARSAGAQAQRGAQAGGAARPQPAAVATACSLHAGRCHRRSQSGAQPWTFKRLRSAVSFRLSPCHLCWSLMCCPRNLDQGGSACASFCCDCCMAFQHLHRPPRPHLLESYGRWVLPTSAMISSCRLSPFTGRSCPEDWAGPSKNGRWVPNRHRVPNRCSKQQLWLCFDPDGEEARRLKPLGSIEPADRRPQSTSLVLRFQPGFTGLCVHGSHVHGQVICSS